MQISHYVPCINTTCTSKLNIRAMKMERHVDNILHVNDALFFITQVKITDFGLAKSSEDNGGLKTFCGTPHYFAPEVQNQQAAGATHSAQLHSTAQLPA